MNVVLDHILAPALKRVLIPMGHTLVIANLALSGTQRKWSVEVNPKCVDEGGHHSSRTSQ